MVKRWQSARQAAKDNGEVTYFTGNPCKYGHVTYRHTSTGTCIECGRQHARKQAAKPQTKKRQRAYRMANRKKCIEYRRNWRSIESNREKDRETSRRWKNANKEWCREYSKRWAIFNHDKVIERVCRRRAQKEKAVPIWVTDDMVQEMKSIYDKRPEGYQVDHIIPLSGRGVCGLHVPWNLQYLEQSENWQKSNNYEPTKASATHTPYMTIDRE